MGLYGLKHVFAFGKPKGITVYEYNPVGVIKAAISRALLDNRTCHYPVSRSNLLTNLADPT